MTLVDVHMVALSLRRRATTGMANVTQAEFEAIILAQVRELWTNYGNLTESATFAHLSLRTTGALLLLLVVVLVCGLLSTLC